MLFLNLSSDNIYLINHGKTEVVEHENIENILGPKLIEMYKNDEFKEVFVLNGPGGFTNLRVGSLCINLLNSLNNNQIKAYSISKSDLYQYLFDKGFLDKKLILIYIGQRKNIWIYDFENKKYELKSYKDLENINLDEIILDCTKPDYRSNNLKNIDENNMINFENSGNEINVIYKGKKMKLDHNELKISFTYGISRNYLVDCEWEKSPVKSN